MNRKLSVLIALALAMTVLAAACGKKDADIQKAVQEKYGETKEDIADSSRRADANIDEDIEEDPATRRSPVLDDEDED
jgi:type IV pilus biogenesis protein CpaD/CtpE